MTLDRYTHCMPAAKEEMIVAYGDEFDAALEREMNKG
jgi:hypothetical protein